MREGKNADICILISSWITFIYVAGKSTIDLEL